MRIREVFFRDFRAFRGSRTIPFVDPLTDAALPVTVIAGTNGTGKTTILDTIEALLKFVIDPQNPPDLISEIPDGGQLGLVLEFSDADEKAFNFQPTLFGEVPAFLRIVAGRQNLNVPNLEVSTASSFSAYKSEIITEVSNELALAGMMTNFLQQAVKRIRRGQIPLYGGMLYFPHGRSLSVSKGGPIEPPPEDRSWVYRYTPSTQWQGSLEQLWVWQNYLDLERKVVGRESLRPFVATLEEILGPDRPISVREGRAQVPVSWTKPDGTRDKVRLDQLPSGEQQVLLLFGELARWRREGAIIAIDEPEISLHPTLQRLVIHQLRRLAREWDAQIILSTHSMEILRTVHESERLILDRLDDPEPVAEPIS